MNAPAVQWIEYKIPVLEMRVRFPPGVQNVLKISYLDKIGTPYILSNRLIADSSLCLLSIYGFIEA